MFNPFQTPLPLLKRNAEWKMRQAKLGERRYKLAERHAQHPDPLLEMLKKLFSKK